VTFLRKEAPDPGDGPVLFNALLQYGRHKKQENFSDHFGFA